MKSENLNFSEKEVAEIRRRVFVIWWNVLAFYQSFAASEQKIDWETYKPTTKHVMDKWLVGRVSQLVNEVTKNYDQYDVIRASRAVMAFIDELSTWYLRLSRDRFRSDTAVINNLGWALYMISKLAAPVTPFFSELVFQTLTKSEDSVHLADWSVVEVAKIENTQLLDEMLVVRKIVEQAHALRKEKAVKVRQPLAKLTIKLKELLSNAGEFESILLQELNVKNIVWEKLEALAVDDVQTMQVEFEWQLTKELEAEGEAREIIRKIQSWRKQEGFSLTSIVEISYPNWPEAWQEEIERKTNTKLTKGEVIGKV